MTTRPQALALIHQLMAEFKITASELSAGPTVAGNTLLTKVMIYLGGILVVAGLSTYIGMKWTALDSVLRVALTFGPGLICFIGALTAMRYEDKSGMAIATPLFFIAAIYQTCGLFVFLGEYSDGNDAPLAALMVFGVMALQYLMAFLRYKTPSLALFTLVFAHFTFAALFEKMGVEPRYYTALLGMSGVLIASALQRTYYASITGLGFIFSGFSFTAALYVILKGTPFDIALIAIACALIYLSVMVESKSLLLVAVISMLGYLGYYTQEYFKDIVGWPIALMVLGIILIVGSNYAIRLGRRFGTTS